MAAQAGKKAGRDFVIIERGDWAVFAMMVVALVAVAVWAVWGTIETTVRSEGIIISAAGVREIQAPEPVVVEQLLVEEGDIVAVGDPVAKLDLPRLRTDIEEADQRLSDILDERRQVRERNKPAARGDGAVLGSSFDRGWQSYLEYLKHVAKKRREDLQDLQAQLDEHSTLESPHAGRVIQIVTFPGERAQPGEAIVVIEPTDAPLRLVAFVPQRGERPRKGAQVSILPSTVDPDEYGYVKGTVRSVSLTPQSRSAMMRFLHNEDVVNRLSQQGEPYRVEIEIERDEDTATGFAWTLGAGPSFRLPSGTLCSADIVVREVSPLALAFPSSNR